MSSGGARSRSEQLARAQAEQVARASYGRLLALLAAPGGDIEVAEDCLSDAFQRALTTWPDAGVPDNPEGWLLTVARNRLRDLLKGLARRASVPLDEALGSIGPTLEGADPDAIPDERLALLFVCGHPAIEAAARAPLMLQTVLGFDASRIARAFAVRPSAMAQRLVRAKRRIRAARIPFAVPARGRMAERLSPVLEAIYGAYSIDWSLGAGPAPSGALAAEAHYLSGLVAELLPDEPEALGLAALLSLSLSRQAARDSEGALVALEAQDPDQWDADLIAEGERYLARAGRLGRIGRFQIEAAIQSVHCDRARSGATDWEALLTLYVSLVAMAPTLGARVALAAIIGRVDGPDAGLAALERIQDERLAGFQPAWATRAHLLAEAAREAEARAAYAKAISLTTEPGMRRYLEGRAALCSWTREEPEVRGGGPVARASPS